MNCEECGRPLTPAPARFDGEPTTVGFFPCACSRMAWLNCTCSEHGATLADHREYCAGVQSNDIAAEGGSHRAQRKNQLYWAYNLPLQVWPMHQDPNDEESQIVGARVLNYMPRRERCEECDLNDLIGEQTREEFFESAALVLENLARLMREAGKDPAALVYYPDAGMKQIA